MPFNITGQPAISLPIAESGSGLPIGVQLVGAPEREDWLVALAAQLMPTVSGLARTAPGHG